MYTYNIRVRFEETIDNKRNIDYTDRAVEIMFSHKGDIEMIGYKKPGKKRFTWIYLPTEYQMEKYFKFFKVTIKRVETGEEIYNYSNE